MGKRKRLINTLLPSYGRRELTIPISRSHHAIVKRSVIQWLITNSQSRCRKERCNILLKGGFRSAYFHYLTVLGNPRFDHFVLARSLSVSLINREEIEKPWLVQLIILTWRMPDAWVKLAGNCFIPVISPRR